jgi:hypothetical protein
MNGLDRDRTGGVVGGSRAAVVAWFGESGEHLEERGVRRLSDGSGGTGVAHGDRTVRLTRCPFMP